MAAPVTVIADATILMGSAIVYDEMFAWNHKTRKKSLPVRLASERIWNGCGGEESKSSGCKYKCEAPSRVLMHWQLCFLRYLWMSMLKPLTVEDWGTKNPIQGPGDNWLQSSECDREAITAWLESDDGAMLLLRNRAENKSSAHIQPPVQCRQKRKICVQKWSGRK